MENRINHIIARVLSGESSSDDILSLSEWLNENEKNRDEFRRLKNYWDADVAFKHSVAPAFSADKLQERMRAQGQPDMGAAALRELRKGWISARLASQVIAGED